ncbi:MAG TPA: aspartate aminotransferase family protein [Dehalococcoidales bacterium]|nr:aspartate aminotransferase family protein [Dehalococcoidales bacterium]
MQNRKLSSSQELTKKYMMNFINRIPVTFVKGQGVRLWDEDGKEYLDFVGGWAVDSLGHCHPVLTKALIEQARELIHVSNAYYTLPLGKLAELLVTSSCFQKVFFCNSGAEANEGAVKLARRWGALKLNGASEVITAYMSFHGRTLAMVAATGQAKMQKPYLPLVNGFVNVEYNSIEAVKQATTQATCAVMIEPLQGEGGVNIPSIDYLRQLRAWCDEKNLMLIYDEVQTGMGRLGKLFGYQVFGVEPDVITLAKGIASGVPIGAILSKERTAVFSPGEHGTTFGGNPLACAAGYAVTRYIIEKDVPDNAEKMGKYLTLQLKNLQKKHPVISDVRGMGLLLGVEFKQEIAEKVMYACLERGLVINFLKPNLLRVIPPLIIARDDIDEGIQILDEALVSLNY